MASQMIFSMPVRGRATTMPTTPHNMPKPSRATMLASGLMLTLLPTTWLFITSMSAGWQKIFSDNPKIGFLALADKFKMVRDGWNGFNVLHMAASRMGGLMLGYAQPGGVKDIVAAKPKLAFFLGAD